MQKGVIKSVFYNGVNVGKWCDKHIVNYIITEVGNEMWIFTYKRGIVIEKPVVISSYNKYMSGIDWQGQMMGYYPCGRKTIQWYKKLVHVLQISLLNAYLCIQNTLKLWPFLRFSIRNKLVIVSFGTKYLSSCKTNRMYIHRISKIESNTTREERNGKVKKSY